MSTTPISNKHLKNITRTKKDLISEINKINESLKIIGKLEYVELPNRLNAATWFGGEGDDCIIAAMKDHVIMNNFIDIEENKIKMSSLPVEVLLQVLIEVEKYKEENY